jgi:asparagine synthase (glutamine-hydrolysing)
MCRVTGADLFTMARLVAGDLVRPVRSLRWTGDSSFLQGDFDTKDLDDLLEPYLHDPFAGPLGKAQHIAMVMRIRNYIEGDERATSPAIIAPLVSQPVVEFCLSVATWQWASGGVNRSLARKAFADHLPPQIIARTAKAGPDSFTAQLFVRNRSVLRSMLLDGVLASNGIIDRGAVEIALTDPALVQAQGHHRLLMLTEAEAWCRSILDRKAKQARS